MHRKKCADCTLRPRSHGLQRVGCDRPRIFADVPLVLERHDTHEDFEPEGGKDTNGQYGTEDILLASSKLLQPYLPRHGPGIFAKGWKAGREEQRPPEYVCLETLTRSSSSSALTTSPNIMCSGKGSATTQGIGVCRRGLNGCIQFVKHSRRQKCPIDLLLTSIMPSYLGSDLGI